MPTSDVINGTAKNGTIVVSCLPTGYYKTNDCASCNPTAKTGQADSVTETQLTDRFDDPTYYTA